MKVLFVGATKGIGRALARRMAEDGDELFLVGRDVVDLERSARDLEVRAARPAGSFGLAPCDLGKPEGFAAALDAAQSGLVGGFDTVVITGGLFASQDKLESDPAFTGEMLTVNFTGTVLFCEAVRKRLLERGGGTLCVFSSVAGERGRKPVVLYGAAKAGLTHYLEGLDHKFRSRGLKVVTVKPGFVKTSMTEGLKPPPFAGDPEAVAASVLRAIARGKPVVYAPAIWGLVMFVIRMLPRFIMRRIGF
ncbi:MAG: SDR family NAD(P)-dependent oxidoreductase [Deltaproteobacteria bacterium]|nr:SDR family NAD(P)-dependent oxidoreductase [Deltaproteobacteria bacterium]